MSITVNNNYYSGASNASANTSLVRIAKVGAPTQNLFFQTHHSVEVKDLDTFDGDAYIIFGILKVVHGHFHHDGKSYNVRVYFKVPEFMLRASVVPALELPGRLHRFKFSGGIPDTILDETRWLFHGHRAMQSTRQPPTAPQPILNPSIPRFVEIDEAVPQRA